MGRRLLLAVVIAALFGGCASPSFPSQPEPTGSAAEPVPSGALYGRVLRQDGRAATRSTVQAYQLSDEDKLRLGVAVASLGFFCLVPGFCPSPVSAKVNARGGYSYPADKIKPVPHVTVTARHAPDPGQTLGAQVTAVFDHPAGTQQRVPDLRYWEPTVTVRQTGTSAAVSWPALGTGAGYELWVVGTGPGATGPQPTGVQTTGTGASVDLRPYEDEPTELILVATTTVTVAGQSVTFSYHAGGVPLPTAGAAPSRGRPCQLGDPGAPLAPAAAPCPLTDGNLHTNAAVPASCPTGTAASGCPEPVRHRICVDLGTARPVSLVVYRTPFPATDTVVELSADGVRFRTVGRPSTVDTGDLRATRIDPPVTATLACVRSDRFGFGGAVLDELSAW